MPQAGWHPGPSGSRSEPSFKDKEEIAFQGLVGTKCNTGKSRRVQSCPFRDICVSGKAPSRDGRAGGPGKRRSRLFLSQQFPLRLRFSQSQSRYKILSPRAAPTSPALSNQETNTGGSSTSLSTATEACRLPCQFPWKSFFCSFANSGAVRSALPAALLEGNPFHSAKKSSGSFSCTSRRGKSCSIFHRRGTRELPPTSSFLAVTVPCKAHACYQH